MTIDLPDLDLDHISIPVLSETHFAKNSLLEWSVAVLLFLAVMVVIRLAKSLVGRQLAKRHAPHAGTDHRPWIEVVYATGWSLYLAIGLSVARLAVALPPRGEKLLTAFTSILIGIQIARWAQAILGALLEIWAVRQGNDGRAQTAAAGIRFIGRLVIWIVITLIVLANLGVQLTAVVAGLGVGGVAAALAVQSILGDLFAGLFMYFDRPFDIGDFVVFGDVSGNVRSIGLRTTRISSLSGEQVVMPNGDLAKRAIRNYGRLQERRIVFTLGVEYGQDPEKLVRARSILEEIVREQPDLRFDRAHFKGFGSYSLDFEVVYFVLSGEYNLYMDRQQAINLEICRRFRAEDIPLALPTQTMRVLDNPLVNEGGPPPPNEPPPS